MNISLLKVDVLLAGKMEKHKDVSESANYQTAD